VDDPGPRDGSSTDGAPPEYQRILTVVRKAGEPVAVRQVGEVLGLDVGAWGKPEPHTVDAGALVVQGVDLG
jgi:hypothetical protein